MSNASAGLRICAAALLLACLETSANAACFHKGVWSKQTTIPEEFGESKWVVRAKVMSAVDGQVERGKPDAGMSWTVYRLKVIARYKGNPPTEIKFFTGRNSGGFYMDRPWVPLPKGHDIGGEYLLFLNPIAPHADNPRAAAGAAFVNYNCGRSKSWSQVDGPTRRQLKQLAASN